MRFPSSAIKLGETHASIGMEEGLPRLWRGFMAARIFVATVLLALLVFVNMMAPTPHAGGALLLCIAYLALTWGVRLWGKPARSALRFDPQWLVTVGADVAVFSTLLYLQVGGVNFTPLFALPVLLAAVLGPLLLALGTAAAVTLSLLFEAWQISISGAADVTSRYLQTALTGIGLFVVAYLANQLALRLARQERIAGISAMVARAQTQVNQLVIDSLSDGILVVDVNGIARTTNPAARAMLGPRTQSAGTYDSTAQIVLPPNTPFVLASHAAWQPLVELAGRTLSTRRTQDAEVALMDSAGALHRLRVRTQLAVANHESDNDDDTLCVLFLEDLRELEARLRTDKLAAMGRMSAAVAHEIRNPLAAISQANALLSEEMLSPTQLRLTSMVQHNAKRLARIVDDVLDVSRVAPATGSGALLYDAEHTILTICRDWATQNGCVDQLRLPEAKACTTVVFEEDHLRRVLVNLLDNSLRYASKHSSGIEVFIQSPEQPKLGVDGKLLVQSAVRLAVWSDAPPIEQGVQRHLFEPFFSSESRSSGLGLYICRELCTRHGAQIGYQRSERAEHKPEGVGPSQAGNEFFVLLNTASNLVENEKISQISLEFAP
jgi:two-component system, NtrC family, sensor histidine kinase PilS